MVIKYLESLEKAKYELMTADHFAYVSLPLIKDNRLMLKILEQLSKSILNLVNSILQFEYINKKIEIYNNPQDNFSLFLNICSKYTISLDEKEKIIELLKLAEEHKKSAMEFVKSNKIVIMASDSRTNILSIEKIKEYILVIKSLIKKTESKFNLNSK